MLQSVTRTLVLIMLNRFNGHPPLGVNATARNPVRHGHGKPGFNGHPPLGVNATARLGVDVLIHPNERFQWAPTLGGECYC